MQWHWEHLPFAWNIFTTSFLNLSNSTHPPQLDRQCPSDHHTAVSQMISSNTPLGQPNIIQAFDHIRCAHWDPGKYPPMLTCSNMGYPDGYDPASYNILI
jgi:hypothetical protein